MSVKKAILILLVILLSSVPLSTVKGQGTYIIINETGVVGSESISQEDNVFTIIEPIRKPIRIEVDDIILDGGGNKIEVATSYDAITIIGRNNIVLQNIYVKIAKYGIVLESVTDCTIQDSTIENCNDGIRLTDASTNNIIRNNTVMANERVGIFFKDQSNDNIISGNIINENIAGIAFEDSHRNEIFDNEIYRNEYDGIYLDASNKNLIYQNIANENGQGLALNYGSTNNQVYENVFNYNLDNGIDVDDSNDNRVFGNEMGYNIDYGIDVDVCTLNHFYQNNIHDNRGGIDFYNAQGNFVYSNNFVNNDDAVSFDAEKNHWNSSSLVGGNYWSDYTGEDLDGDGFGDTPRHFRSITIGGVTTIDTDNLDYYPLMDPFRRTSVITCVVDPQTIIEGESVEISGSVTPAPDSEVSVLLNIVGPEGSESESPSTNEYGEYMILFTPTRAGSWSVSASWDGNTKYLGDTNDEFTFNVAAAQIITPPEPDEPAPQEPINTRIVGLTFDSSFAPDTTLIVSGSLVLDDNEGIGDQDVTMKWIVVDEIGGLIEIYKSRTVQTSSDGSFTTTFMLDVSGANYQIICTFSENSPYEFATAESAVFNVGAPQGFIPGMSAGSLLLGILIISLLIQIQGRETYLIR